MDASLPHSSQGPSPPIGSLGRELARVQRTPGLIALGVAAVVGLGGPLLVLRFVEDGFVRPTGAIAWIWIAAAVAVGSALAACAIAAFLPPLLLRGPSRTAQVVHAWLGAREIRRLYGSTSGAFEVPTTPELASLWLDSHPDTPDMRPLRFELLVMLRRFDEARAVIERFPTTTPLQEFRIVEAEALVLDQSTGEFDDRRLEEAAQRVPVGDDRAEALASVAGLRARRLVGRGDWRAPLVEARPFVPGSDVEILLRDMGLPIFNRIWPLIVLPIAALAVVAAVVITVMAIL